MTTDSLKDSGGPHESECRPTSIGMGGPLRSESVAHIVGIVKTDNNSAGWFELRFHATLLRRIHYVSFDDHKKSIVAPDWEPIGHGRFYFYKADSIRYAVHRFWIDIYKRDDSKGLMIRGRGESAMEAHARWKGQYNIPVLEPGELEDFLQQHQVKATMHTRPATDPEEQNELYTRYLLDFDDWRRNQRRDKGKHGNGS